MHFHLESILEGETEKDNTDNIAKQFLTIGCVAFCQLIGSKSQIFLLGSLHKFSLHIINLDDLGCCNAFLKDSHKLIFVVIVMRDNLSLNRSQEDKDGDVDGSNEGHDNDDCMFVGSNEEDSSDEDDAIFIDGKDVVPSYEHLFVVLNR